LHRARQLHGSRSYAAWICAAHPAASTGDCLALLGTRYSAHHLAYHMTLRRPFARYLICDADATCDHMTCLGHVFAAGRITLPVRMASTAGVDLYPHGLKPVTGGVVFLQARILRLHDCVRINCNTGIRLFRDRDAAFSVQARAWSPRLPGKC
jgi:hypothetical protein